MTMEINDDLKITEVYRKEPGNNDSPAIHVINNGYIAIGAGREVVIMSIERWFRLGQAASSAATPVEIPIPSSPTV